MPFYNKSACDVCSKCARTFHARGTNENVIKRKMRLLLKLHTKKCKGKMKLSPSICRKITQREMDNHLNVVPKTIMERARVVAEDKLYGLTV